MLSTEVRAQTLHHWREVANQHFLELECIAPDRPHFYCSALVTPFGDSLAAELRLSALRVVRRKQVAENASQAYFKLFWQLEGKSRIHQGRQESLLQPGMWSVYDTSRAYEIESTDRSRALVLLIPQSESRGWTPAVRALAGQGLNGGGPAQIVLASLAALLRDPTPLNPDSQHALQDATVNLLENALHERARALLPVTGPSRMQLEQIKEYINENLANPELSVDAVAQALGISRRTLYNLFVPTGTTPRAYIQNCRLQRAQELLSQPAWLSCPVAEIAQLCGFSDPAHFSRAFASRHRMPPAIWRRRHLGLGNTDFP